MQQPGIGATVPHVLDAKRFYQHPKLGLLAPPGLPFVVRIASSPDAGAENYMLGTGPTLPAQTPEPLTFTAPGRNTVSVAIAQKGREALASPSMRPRRRHSSRLPARTALKWAESPTSVPG